MDTTSAPDRTRRRSPTSAGTRAGPPPSLPFDAAGALPARVVAAHRDAWVLRDAVRRPRRGRSPGRLRHEALGPGDLPGRRRLGRRSRHRRRDRDHGRDPRRAPPPDRVPAQHRRVSTAADAGRRAGPGRERGRRLRRRGPRRRLQPAPSRAIPGRRVERRHDARDRPQQGRRGRGPRRAPRRGGGHRTRRRGPRRSPPSPATAWPPRERPPRAGPHGGRARVLGRRQVDARQRPAGRGAPAHQRRSARTTRGAATRPPTGSSSGCRAARSSSTRRASGRSGSPARPTASTPRSPTSPTSRPAAASATAATTREPGCAVRAALQDGRLDGGALRQPPQARAGGGPRRPVGRSPPPGRGATPLARRSTTRCACTWTTSTGATDDHPDPHPAAGGTGRLGCHVPPVARHRGHRRHGRRQRPPARHASACSSRSTSRRCATATRTSSTPTRRWTAMSSSGMA